ncbi:Cytochrome P450 CYP4, partial [Frankliniella occidentalis]
QYMDRVVNETLRMFPIAPFVARQTSKVVELDGKHIPSGTVLFLNFVGVHRSPKYHQDPLTFDPDRFLPDRAAAMHPYSFLPFSSGSRNCIGQPLAWMMVKTLLASILKTYQ